MCRWLVVLVSARAGAALALDSIYPPIAGPALGSENILEDNVYYLLDGNGVPTKDGVSADNYNVHMDGTTVTLNNAALTTPLYVPGGTTVELIGTNSIGSSGSKVSTCLQTMTPGNLTITGTGSLSGFDDAGDGIITDGSTGDIIING